MAAHYPEDVPMPSPVASAIFRRLRWFPLSILTVSISLAQWNVSISNTTAALRGIHNVGNGVIWASGANGTVLRSEDDGFVWQQCSVPDGAAKLDFRGVYGWDGDRAVVLSSGPGASSRVYETTDGCSTWRLLFQNPDREGFWDALTFRGKKSFLLGDPIGGRFTLYHSDDLGQRWSRDPSSGLAAAGGEGAFAASNSSLAAVGDAELVIGTGGAGGPRVLRLGKTGAWRSVEVPLAKGRESTGVFSISFRDRSHGIAVGGDYKDPTQRSGTAAWTSDGGLTWHASATLPSGYRSSVAWDQEMHLWISVGPNGSDLSLDDGHTWRRFDGGNWNALSLPWVVGPGGKVARLDRASPALTKAMRGDPLRSDRP